MDLPNCIQAYFEADNRNDLEVLMATMSPEAIVEDEHRRHAGPEAIRNWWIEAKRKTPHVNAPIDATTTGDVTQVRTRVSGDFPGSPVTLLFTFTVANDAIARLEIA